MKLIGLASGNSRNGLTRIGRLLGPTIQLDVMNTVPEDVRGYSGVIGHNVFSDMSGGRLPRLVYLASNATERIIRSPASKAALRGAKAVWVNSETSKALLENCGITTKVMYRPNKVRVPSECPPTPQTRKILWHWLRSGPTMNYRTESITSKVMLKLIDLGFEITIINSSNVNEGPAGTEGKVSFAGRMDLTVAPDWLGMIRTYDQVDLGRSTFQVVAQGRWALYWRTHEPFTESVDTIRQAVETVAALEVEPRERAVARWRYARDNFREPILRERWQRAVVEVFA